MSEQHDVAAAPGPPLDAPALPGRVVFDQEWRDLVFVHWPVRPRDVEQFMPPGVRVDVWRDGMTYVGLVPFRMRRAGFGPNMPLPYFGSFLEWNVRLYSVDDAGRHGVVFRSLDATRLPVVALANAGGVPYRWARISASRSNGGEVSWQMRRLARRSITSSLRLRVGEPTEPTPLESFLVSRWGMHSTFAGRTIWVPNRHGRWPLYAADIVQLADGLVDAAGVPMAGAPLRALWSPGVRARFSWPQVVPVST
ncbi:YqjF family protein [uncultured Jatrophihabitans sp.]|uniref:YqjF family protein n=1 Tax=uncultured Jatrophihabitans sp. TaxID=1610747 RepID=UPI0035CAD5E9